MTEISEWAIKAAREAAITVNTPARFAANVRAGKHDDVYPIPSIARALEAVFARGVAEKLEAERDNDLHVLEITNLRNEVEDRGARIAKLVEALKRIALTERRNMTPQNRMKLIYDTCFGVLGESHE